MYNNKTLLFIITVLCAINFSYSQCLTDNFNSGYGNWTGTGTYQNGTAGRTGNGTGFNSTGDNIITNAILTNPQTLTLWLARTSSTDNRTLSIEYSTSNTGPWTSARDILVSEVTTTHEEFTVNLDLVGDFYLRIAMTQRVGGSYYLDDINVVCGISCTPTHSITNFSPTSGPELTHVTITGAGFSAMSTVNFNGVSANVTFINSTTLIAEVPTGASTGVITITESGCDVDTTSNFSILADNCGSGGISASFTGLMFSGVYDDQTDSCHYIELLNPTASAIDLSTYIIGVDNNFTLGSTPPTSGFNLNMPLSGTILAGETLMIRLSSSGACTSCATISPDLSFTGGGLNDEDRLVLVNSGTAEDVWQNHSNPGAGFNVGYVYTRNNTANAPTTTFSLSDWDSDGNEDCFGFEISTVTSPTITLQPLDVDDCDTASFNLSITAGGTGTLSYQWKYNDGNSVGWTDVMSTTFSPGVVTGETTSNLSIFGFNLDGYQFYCEITETGTCSIATDAVQVTMPFTTWDGASWSNGIPDSNTMAIINGGYDTSSNGSFTACSLIVNANTGSGPEYRLNIANNTYVEIENNATVDGELYVQTQGAFVQNNNNSGFNLTSTGTALVNKSTTPLNSVYDYTYWSSPIQNAMIQDALAFANPNRRYWFNAANFLDVLVEIDNTNTYTTGADGIDDDGNAWTLITDGTDIMSPGLGYASMHTPIGFIAGTQYTYTFSGSFNTGIVNTAISYNGANGDEDWNLIGNPYPSAIDANAFLTNNSSIIGGAAYLWSQNTAADSNTSGNQNYNFSQDDYAIITNGSGNTAGGDMIIPNNYIPSGQSFFVQGLSNTNVVFDNSIRMADETSNGQFFRTNENTNRLWVNLTSDNGVFNQVLIAYVNGATDGRDSVSYDARRSIYNQNASVIYTEIENDADRFAIQGKAPESLTLEEIIPLGFETAITVPTIYSLSIARIEGDFMTSNTIYLKDNILNIIHNLSDSEYTFTSLEGNYNSRFQIIFNIETLSVDEFETNSNSISITELDNDVIEIEATDNLKIKAVKIIDALGRPLYFIKGQNKNVITFSLSNLNQALYLAQIELSNGKIITKKAIKK